MKSIVLTIERVTGSVGFLASLIVIPLILTTSYEVMSRYLFEAPTTWAYELGYMFTGSHFLLGAALTLARGGHIRIDVIYGQLSDRPKAMIDLVFYVVLFLPFLALLNEALWSYAAHAFQSGERSGQSAWSPPIWPFRMLLFISFLLLMAQVVAESLKAIAVLRRRPIDSQEA